MTTMLPPPFNCSKVVRVIHTLELGGPGMALYWSLLSKPQKSSTPIFLLQNPVPSGGCRKVLERKEPSLSPCHIYQPNNHTNLSCHLHMPSCLQPATRWPPRDMPTQVSLKAVRSLLRSQGAGYILRTAVPRVCGRGSDQ